MTNEELTALVGRLVQVQISTQEQIKQLGQHIDLYVASSNAFVASSNAFVESSNAFVASSNAFVESSNAYVKASNARMEQMEANLDALIRAITAEHSNGKKKD